MSLAGVAAGIFGPPGVDTAFAGLPAEIANGTINIIPEPTTIALLAAGCLPALRRRK